MARRTSRSRFIRPAPRTKMWIGMGVGSTAIAGTTAVLESSLSAAALALRPFTILRSRLELIWESDQVAVDELPQGFYAHIVVTDAASAIGSTAVPDPNGNPDADWFIYQPLMTSFQFITAAGFEGNFGSHFTIDSKAMRKVGPDDDEVSMISNPSSFGATITTRGRQLIQLH